MKKSNKSTVKINFNNKEAAKHFLSWLCEQGEQDYWLWMEEQEREEKGNITAINFDYFRGKKSFAPNLEIDAECGRLSSEDD